MSEETNPYLYLIQELFKDLLQRAEEWEEERKFVGEDVPSVDLGDLSDKVKEAFRGMSKLTDEEKLAHRRHAHVNFMPETQDLDQASSDLAKEVTQLHHLAPGHPNIGGRHMSPADTDPDMGATGRRARGEERT